MKNKAKIAKIILIILSIFIIVGIVCLAAIRFYIANRSLTDLGGDYISSWCKAAETIQLKGNTLTIVDIEDYNGEQLQGKMCHLTLLSDNLTTDYYLDEGAIAKIRGGKSKEIGNGCFVYRIGKVFTSSEVCFGDKAVFKEEEGAKEEYGELYNELNKASDEAEKMISSPPQTSPSVNPTVNLSGTRWRYQIDVGGGVGGILTFGKDENGKSTGTFTESGPEGNKEKFFIGSLEKDKFLLTLEDFPTFKLTLSSDGRTMTGKPLEENKDIYYPDNFFKATLEK